MINSTVGFTDPSNGSSDLSSYAGDIIPAIDNTYVLGNSSYRWKSISIGDGTIYITDALTGGEAALTIEDGIFFINGIAQAQLPNLQVTNLTFLDNTTQTTAAVPQINSDWNSISGLSEILNKPTIPSDINQLEDADNLLSTDVTYASKLQHEVKAGESLTKGQAVYASSADGTNIVVSKGSNASEQTSSKIMGLIASTLSTNAKGTVITEGLLAGLNTSSANAGDPVWLGTSGNLIYGLTNKPVAPAHLVFIGIVTRSNNTNGEIFVRPQNGFELNEIHDVLIGSGYGSTPLDNDVLAYDSTSGVWKNQTAAQAGLQTRVLNVSDAEIGYLSNVTSDIQTQLNQKPDLLSPTITMASFASANSGVDPVTISTANAHGGAGYAGIMTIENSTSGATNAKKFIRLNNTGGLEIVNNAYTDTIFYLADNGNLSELGTVNGATIGDTSWQSVSSFSNGFTAPTSVAYRKINNVVYMRGNLNNGIANTVAFTLPDGYRPSVNVVVPVQQYGTANTSYVTVNTNGDVTPNASAGWLSSIIFPVG